MATKIKIIEKNLENASDAYVRVSFLVDEQDALKLKRALILNEMHKFNLIGNALKMFKNIKTNEEDKEKMLQQFIISVEFLINIEDFFKENFPESYKDILSQWTNLHSAYEILKDLFVQV